jgi:hypothetical protein
MTAEFPSASHSSAAFSAGNLPALVVRPEEFLRLVLSRRKVVRADDAHNSIRGLVDMESGQRYVVDGRLLEL